MSVDLTQAREALADHLLPRCNVHMPGGQDEDGPIPGCPCDRHIDHDGEHYAPEDVPTWEHLRDALAEVDRLRARLTSLEHLEASQHNARARDVAPKPTRGPAAAIVELFDHMHEAAEDYDPVSPHVVAALRALVGVS